MIQEVCHPENRGLSNCVFQLNKEQESDALEVCHATRAAGFTCDDLSQNLIEVYVYDTKSVHFFCMIYKDIK